MRPVDWRLRNKISRQKPLGRCPAPKRREKRREVWDDGRTQVTPENPVKSVPPPPRPVDPLRHRTSDLLTDAP